MGKAMCCYACGVTSHALFQLQAFPLDYAVSRLYGPWSDITLPLAVHTSAASLANGFLGHEGVQVVGQIQQRALLVLCLPSVGLSSGNRVGCSPLRFLSAALEAATQLAHGSLNPP